jgi:hypothetical protein
LEVSDEQSTQCFHRSRTRDRVLDVTLRGRRRYGRAGRPRRWRGHRCRRPRRRFGGAAAGSAGGRDDAERLGRARLRVGVRHDERSRGAADVIAPSTPNDIRLADENDDNYLCVTVASGRQVTDFVDNRNEDSGGSDNGSNGDGGNGMESEEPETPMT